MGDFEQEMRRKRGRLGDFEQKLGRFGGISRLASVQPALPLWECFTNSSARRTPLHRLEQNASAVRLSQASGFHVSVPHIAHGTMRPARSERGLALPFFCCEIRRPAHSGEHVSFRAHW